MKTSVFAVVVAGTLLPPVLARSQQIEIGPGGIYLNNNHERNWGRECEELRRACEFKYERGERGEGNCRRYRELCR